jgi:uncharacterized membrane protein YphA (DoxX/SURF4 family)
MLRNLARALIGAVYVQQGIEILRHPHDPADAAKPAVARLAASTPLPDDPVVVVRASGIAMAAGGLGLATNTAPRLSAALLSVVTALLTFARHPVGTLRLSTLRGPEGTRLLTDLGMLGAVILAALDTEGRPGLTYRAQKGSERAARGARRRARSARRSARREARIVKLELREARRASRDAGRAAVVRARSAAQDTARAVSQAVPSAIG